MTIYKLIAGYIIKQMQENCWVMSLSFSLLNLFQTFLFIEFSWFVTKKKWSKYRPKYFESWYRSRKSTLILAAMVWRESRCESIRWFASKSRPCVALKRYGQHKKCKIFDTWRHTDTHKTLAARKSFLSDNQTNGYFGVKTVRGVVINLLGTWVKRNKETNKKTTWYTCNFPILCKIQSWNLKLGKNYWSLTELHTKSQFDVNLLRLKNRRTNLWHLG